MRRRKACGYTFIVREMTGFDLLHGGVFADKKA
jgi:hypothetical protein